MIVCNDCVLILFARFEWIHHYLHCDLNWVIEELKKNFAAHWELGTHVSVDEAMIKFKGVFSGRQHCRGKPANTGLKAFTNADAHTSYLYDFWIYEVCVC